MIRTIIRDCLQLNWALPVEALAPAPAPLRYEIHSWEGERFVFASALLFRHEGLRVKGVPGLKLSYPQFNLRLNVLDGESTPAVLLTTILVPSWVVPAARLAARQRPRSGLLQYPPQGVTEGAEPLTWTVRRRRTLEVRASPGSPCASAGPRLGDWEQTVKYFRGRERGYSRVGRSLRRIEATYRSAPTVPVKAEVLRDGLLRDSLPLESDAWPPLHSAWLCPESPCVFEWGDLAEATLRHRAPAPG